MDINYYKKYEPIDGKWYITNEIGSGAFGMVFEITRRDFPDMKAALKVISIPTSQKEIDNYREENYDLDEKSVTSYFESIVDDVKKEFRLMAQLKGNTNIVSYEDHDVKPKKGEFGWDIFIRMELLTPMNKYFAEKNPIQKDIIKLGIDICKALEVCQKYQIIHRDIKPSNIFVSKTGDFKLGDFGVARTLEKTSSGLSKKGTYTYMAPEVFKGESYNSNVDIYSLGILMYKLLNNNMEPFRKDRTFGDSEKAFEKRMIGASIPAPANAKGRLAEIVLKACSFNPKERYENPIQMREELENILYNDSERNVIYPEGDDVGYETSTNGGSDEKTVSLFGNFTVQENDKNENKTESVFDIDVKKYENNINDSKNKISNDRDKTKKKDVLHLVASGFFFVSLVAYVLYRWYWYRDFTETVINSALVFVMMLPLVIAFSIKNSKCGKKCIIVGVIMHLLAGIESMADSFSLIVDLGYSKSSMIVFEGNGLLFIGNVIFTSVILINLIKPDVKNKKINGCMWIAPVAFVLIRLVMYMNTAGDYYFAENYAYIVRLVTMAIGYATATYCITKKDNK